MRESIRDYLDGFGYQVVTASGGEEALRIAGQDKAKFDVLVTDIEMPGMDGIELWRRFNVLAPAAQVLFLSGHSADMLKKNGLLPGEVLSKPFDLPKLQELLQEFESKINE